MRAGERRPVVGDVVKLAFALVFDGRIVRRVVIREGCRWESSRLDVGNRGPFAVVETSAGALAIVRGYSGLRHGGPPWGRRSPEGGSIFIL